MQKPTATIGDKASYQLIINCEPNVAYIIIIIPCVVMCSNFYVSEYLNVNLIGCVYKGK